MIKRFIYENLESGWKLEPVDLDRINLFVGPSGAGKTKILEALLEVRKAAFEGLKGQRSSEWALFLEIPDASMEWRARIKVERPELQDPRVKHPWSRPTSGDLESRFEYEELELNGEVIVRRNAELFEYRGTSIPLLDESQSALTLLAAEEEGLRPFRRALQAWLVPYGDSNRLFGSFASIQDAGFLLGKVGSDIESLRNEFNEVPYLKLFVLQEKHRENFRKLLEDFQEIFPTVEEIRVAPIAEFGTYPVFAGGLGANALVVGLRENGVRGWILSFEFSAGMDKTLRLLIETLLAPAEAVFFIDELENSLGLNCLPQIQQHLLGGSSQVLITSHHPRVINKIPMEHWKLVRRQGSTVRVIDAADIPALQTASPLEKFTQLLNAREYEEAIG